jgi:hypothetical protein
MGEEARTRYMLDLDSSRDPIRGTLSAGQAPPQPFFGWLELMVLLEGDAGGPDAQLEEPR